MNNIEQLETDLWAAADNLRANSKLTSSEYCMPVLGIIFLRHATNRYDDAVRQIEADQAAGTMPKRPLVKGDFLKRRALQLPPEARYDTLLELRTGASNVTVDDQRFLMVQPLEQPSSSANFNVVLNWAEGLKRLVPTK